MMDTSRSRLASSPWLAVMLALAPLACGPEPEPAAPAPPVTAAAAPQPAPTALATAAPTQAPAPTAAPAATSAPTAAPAATATASASASPEAKGASYRVCHCCCGGSEAKKQCLYRAKGESLAKIIAEDKKWVDNCPPNAGCRQPIEYVMCD
jgi:hypothetical protein